MLLPSTPSGKEASSQPAEHEFSQHISLMSPADMANLELVASLVKPHGHNTPCAHKQSYAAVTALTQP